MTVESPGYINAIDPTLPLGTDAKSEGDDHLRNFKKSVQDSFPNVDGAVNPTPAEFNQLSGGGLTATGIVEFLKGVDIVSATALTIGTDGNYFDVTGTTTITSIATVGVGTVVKLHFDAALTLTHNATSLVLPGGANITTAAGDEAEFVEYSTGNWRCTNYQKIGNTLLNTKIIDIGDWNMLSTQQLLVPHGLNNKKIRSINLIIRDDADTDYWTAGYYFAISAAVELWIERADPTNIRLNRGVGGVFDTANFDATSYNRGWITIQYVD